MPPSLNVSYLSMSVNGTNFPCFPSAALLSIDLTLSIFMNGIPSLSVLYIYVYPSILSPLSTIFGKAAPAIPSLYPFSYSVIFAPSFYNPSSSASSLSLSAAFAFLRSTPFTIKGKHISDIRLYSLDFAMSCVSLKSFGDRFVVITIGSPAR